MKRILLLIGMAYAFTTSSSAQSFWSDTTGTAFPYSLLDVHASENHGLLAGVIGGLYHSSDQGMTWEKVIHETTNGIAESNGTLYAATDDGLFASTDGLSWDVLMPSDAESVSAFGDLVAVGGSGGQYYFSDDAGQTWTVLTCNLMPQGIDRWLDPIFVSEQMFLFVNYLDDVLYASNAGSQ